MREHNRKSLVTTSWILECQGLPENQLWSRDAVPGDAGDGNPPAKAGDTGSMPAPGKFHMQLRLCTSTEPTA